MALTTKPRWDKYDPYVGNYRGTLAADITLATEANVVLGVGHNSDGAVVIGAGQTGITGLMIVPVGADIHGNLLDGGINNQAGDTCDVGRHGEITNFIPTNLTYTQTVTVTGVPTGGTFTLTLGGNETGTIAYDADSATVKAAIVALDDGHVADDFTVTGDGPHLVTYNVAWGVLTADGALLTGGTDPDVTVDQPVSTSAAGTKYYAHTDGSVNSTSTSGVLVGHTAEASRLIVDV